MTVPTFAAGLFLWLIAYRVLAWWQECSELSTLSLFALAIAVSVATFLGEAIGIAIAFHVSPLRVLRYDFRFRCRHQAGLAGVLAAGLAVTAVDAVMARWRSRPARTPAVAAE